MFLKRFCRIVSAALLLLPLLCLGVVACYSPWAISKEDLRGGKYPPKEQLRLTYPAGSVILFDGWTLDYPRLEGVVDEMRGTIPSEPVAGDAKRRSFNVDDAIKIEIYDFSRTKTTTAVGVPVLTVIVVVLAAALASLLSCPNVYVYQADMPVLIGEAYPGATFRPLAADHFLEVPVDASSQELHLEIRNEHPEKQFIDLASLAVVPHPSATRVISGGDRLYVASHEYPPDRATDSFEHDVLHSVRSRDGKSWQAGLKQIARAERDIIQITFTPKEQGPQLLIVTAENTRWHDMVLGRFFNGLESDYGDFVTATNKASAADLSKWREREGLAIRVELRDGDRWRQVATIPAAGTAGFQQFGVPIGEARSAPLQVRLSAGSGFWRFDSVSVARLVDTSPATVEVSPSRIDARGGVNVAGLAKRDRHSYVMTLTGESVHLFFSLPPSEDPLRTIFLHTRGHYEVNALHAAPHQTATRRTGLEDRGVIRTASEAVLREWQAAGRRLLHPAPGSIR